MAAALTGIPPFAAITAKFKESPMNRSKKARMWKFRATKASSIGKLAMSKIVERVRAVGVSVRGSGDHCIARPIGARAHQRR
jgi:hypothetical protein